MRIRVGVRRMQFAAQFLDKNPDRTAHVRNDRVDQVIHEELIIKAVEEIALPFDR